MLKWPCTMMNRQNLDLIEKESVDDTVALHEDLPNVIPI
jgi:hypothetical protein